MKNNLNFIITISSDVHVTELNIIIFLKIQRKNKDGNKAGVIIRKPRYKTPMGS